jgi:cell wall-associated NlpC family hydrolase
VRLETPAIGRTGKIRRMKPFFDTIERITTLRFHAAKLVDTPFVPHAMIPGVGIDCVHVNAWCYLKTGFLADFAPPRYSMDAGSHSKESALLKWLDGCAQFQKLSTFNLQPSTLLAGDTVTFNLGLSEHHVGLMLDATRLIHCLCRHRVVVSDLEKENFYRRRVSAFYRPIEVAVNVSSLKNNQSGITVEVVL